MAAGAGSDVADAAVPGLLTPSRAGTDDRVTDTRTHRIPLDDAVIGVREYHAPSSGASIVFLPALGVPIGYYEPLFQAWARHVIGVEWRGMPESRVDDLRRARFGYSDLIRGDLPAAVRLARALGAPDVVLVGHSLGGQIALLAAAGGTVRPAAVVAIATGTSAALHLPAHRRWQRRLGVAVVGGVSRAAGHWPGHLLRFGGRQPRSMMRDWAYEARHGRYHLAGDPTDYEAALSDSRVPSLLLALDGDRMVPPAAVAHLARRVGGPAEQITVPAGASGGFDHFTWARRSPRAIIKPVEAWLKQASGPVAQGGGQPAA